MDPIQVKFFLVILNVTTTDISSIFFYPEGEMLFRLYLKMSSQLHKCKSVPNNSSEASGVIGDLHGCNSEQSLTLCGYRYALNLLHYYTASRCAGTSTGEGKI